MDEYAAILSAVADNGKTLPVSEGGSLLCSFAEVGGVRCGIVLSDKNKNVGKIDALRRALPPGSSISATPTRFRS